jgi:hypothetical protein
VCADYPPRRDRKRPKDAIRCYDRDPDRDHLFFWLLIAIGLPLVGLAEALNRGGLLGGQTLAAKERD